MKFYPILFFLAFNLPAYPQNKKGLLYPFSENSQSYGYKNHKGKVIVPPSFENATAFENGYALVKKDKKWGVINEKGMLVISNQFDTIAYPVNKGFFLIGKKNIVPDFEMVLFDLEMYYGLMDTHYKILVPPLYKKIIFSGSDSVSLIGYDQWTIKDFIKDTAIHFGSDRIFINDEAAEIIIDTVPVEWDWRVPVRPKRTWGFADSAGFMRISNRYEDVKSFSEGLAAIKFDGKWGFVDKYENIIIQPNYDFVSRFEKGTSIAEKKMKYGLINKIGKEITPFIFDRVYAGAFNYFIVTKGLKEGIVNSTGKEILATRFDKVCPQEDGRIIIERSNKKGLADGMGSIIFPLQYDEIIYSSPDRKYFLKKKGIIFQISLKNN